jgi:flagellar biosynthesis chaperone FliJ
LLDDYGSTELHLALGEAIKQQSAYPAAVQQILEQRREHRQQPSPIAVSVPEKVKHYQVKAAKLSDYDKLGQDEDQREQEKEEGKDKKEQKKEKPNG